MRPFLLSILLGACDAAPGTAEERGAALARDPALGGEDNAFACTTCHATEDEDGARRLPGRPLAGSAFRASYWGGYARTLRDAVDQCLTYFMDAAPLDPASEDARALWTYLVAISPTKSAPALPLEIVENVSAVQRGEAARGEAVYAAACEGCHGAAHTGEGRIAQPTLDDDDVVLPESTGHFEHQLPGIDPALVLVEKVRHGRFFGVGGRMPPFARVGADEEGFGLSDADLGALIAYFAL